MTKLPFFLLLSAVVPAAGCSFINSFEDVIPAGSGDAGDTDGGDGGGGGAGGSGGQTDSGAGGSLPDASMDGGGGAPEAGAGGAETGAPDSMGSGGVQGSEAGTDAGPDAADAGDFEPGGPNGAVVAYNEDDKELTVLDPEDGSIVSAEALNPVSAIVHDPAKDLWFIFEREAAADEAHTLHVRQLNTTSGQWRELTTLEVPPPATPVANGALPNKLVYLSLPNPFALQADYGFTLLDTSDPRNVEVIKPALRTLPAGDKIGLLVNRQGPSFNVAIQSACGAVGCNVGLLRYTVSGDDVVEDPAGIVKVGEVSLTGGAPGFAVDVNKGVDIVVFPPVALPDGGAPSGCATNGPYETGNVRWLSPATHTETQNPSPFDIAGPRVASAAYDYCDEAVIFNTLNLDQALFAVSPDPSKQATRSCASTQGGDLRYEPYTKSVIRNSAGTLQAYTVDSSSGDPELSQRVFATGFLVNVFAVRDRWPPSCN